jgi:hypothetical protein
MVRKNINLDARLESLYIDQPQSKSLRLKPSQLKGRQPWTLKEIRYQGSWMDLWQIIQDDSHIPSPCKVLRHNSLMFHIYTG